jgi:hypothetical protein
MAQERQESQESQEVAIANVATNEACTQSGPYKSGGTPSVIVFIKKGEKFPNGPTSTAATGQPTTWTLIAGTQATI